MTTPLQNLRLTHLEAQDAVDSLWDLLLFVDPRLTKPYVIQVRRKREAEILQSYCFDSPENAALFFKGLTLTSKGKLPTPEIEALELTPCPPGYVFKEVEPVKRPRRSSKKAVDEDGEVDDESADD